MNRPFPTAILLLCLSAASTFAQTTHPVNVSGTSFNPQNLVIQVGDQVTWTNTSGSHNVNGTTTTYPLNPESFGNSVGSGWTFSHTFNTVGSYNYRCDPHFAMGMTGTVTVNPAPSSPLNDDCANATLLTVGSSCSFQSFDSENATTQVPEPAPGPGCGFYQGGDVWFKTVVPASGALRVEKANGTLNAQFAIYSGTCGSMQVVSCAQLDQARTIHEPSLAGQEVYIRVWGYNNSTGGTFDLCVWEPIIPVNNYCDDAITLTVGQSCSFGTYTSVYSTAE